MQEMKKLTIAEKNFAAEHHALVHQFLRDKGLSENDYYDVVIFRYLRAVQLYLERPWLGQYRFKTIAYQNMRSALGHHYAAQARMKRNATVFSLDIPFRDSGSLTMADVIGTCDSAQEHVESKEVWESIVPRLTSPQLQALRLRAAGYTGRETGVLCGITASGVSSRIYRLRKTAKQHLAA